MTKAWDFKAKKTKSTKAEETRSIPIEPTLLPLLRAMHDGAKGDGLRATGLVMPALAESNPDQLGEITREHFEAARCRRPRPYKGSASERHVVFRSWRDAGITWAIVRGDDLVKVQRRAGHKLISTTQRHIIEAENRGATFGVPFPALSASFIEASKGESKSSDETLQASVITHEARCERRELNPHESYLART